MKQILTLAALAAFLVSGQSSSPIAYPPGSAVPTWVMEPQAIPASPTVIITGSSVIIGGWISCAGTARTVTITDGNSVNFFDTVPIAANSIVGLSIFNGAYIPTSITIGASGTGCKYSLWGRR